MTLSKLLIGLAALVLVPASVCAEGETIEVQVVDSMNKVFGVHLSKALLFGGSTIPVTVRFSDNGGLPAVADGSSDANPHGMAIKFRLPDGSETDMVTNSLKFFPVSTAAELRELFEAVNASPPDAPKPTKFEQFVGAHSQVGPAFATARTPGSLAEEEYQGLNAFVLVNQNSERQAVRYLLVPERVVHLDASEAAARPPDFLMDELPDRLSRGPVVFRLKAQLADPGDPTNDPSQPWPATRKVAELGVITLRNAVSNNADVQKSLLYLPGQITDGIELSDDPMVSIRDGAYAVSFSRRN
jgi:catalase